MMKNYQSMTMKFSFSVMGFIQSMEANCGPVSVAKPKMEKWRVILENQIMIEATKNKNVPYLKKKWIRWNWWSPWKDTNLVFFKGCLFSCCLVWFTWNRSGKTWTLFRWIWWNCCLLQWSGKSIHQGYSVNSFAVLLVFKKDNIWYTFYHQLL